jgi:hypothetical protein
MAGRPILFGPDGTTPVATEQTTADNVEGLLVTAFAFATGLLIAREPPPKHQGVMNSARHDLVVGILGVPGLKEAIETRFDVDLGVDLTTGGVAVRSRMPAN